MIFLMKQGFESRAKADRVGDFKCERVDRPLREIGEGKIKGLQSSVEGPVEGGW